MEKYEQVIYRLFGFICNVIQRFGLRAVRLCIMDSYRKASETEIYK